MKLEGCPLLFEKMYNLRLARIVSYYSVLLSSVSNRTSISDDRTGMYFTTTDHMIIGYCIVSMNDPVSNIYEFSGIGQK
jgi:hypothetical protein